MSTLSDARIPAFMDSRTYQALQSALLGEEQSRRMYLQAAQTFEDAQLHVIAHALRFTAAQEKEHAAIFSGLLSVYGGNPLPHADILPLLPGEPAALLQALAQNEISEAERLYPCNARIALEEGYPRIAAAFQRIAETEDLHARRLRQFEEALLSGALFRAERPVSWYCLACGELRTSCEPPDSCPSCGKNRGYFIRSSHFPFAIEG